ncbi:MAG: hypothetical protein PHT07_24900 [Paludibacter sp.]|nr:hypothetical protein [Paludibacter sp.]
MSNSSADFFKVKNPWSKIKDQILEKYLPPYLNKISKLGNRIVIVDGFAGPGIFDDGSIGSPKMICDISKKHLGNNFIAILVDISVILTPHFGHTDPPGQVLIQRTVLD